ncbi:MAG: aldose epimerase [Nocardioidaceae bacterium]|nr:aldose epimerase [Nocardioidaceae bacterium]
MSDPQLIELSRDGLSVTISTHGAEMHSLRGPDGHEYLWQAGPAWKRHAPTLFPIVCRVPNNEISVDGTTYPMPQHGFARDSQWTLVEVDTHHARFTLTDSDSTRVHFPYAFELAVDYSLDGAGLAIAFVLTNRGDVPLPASLGSHPAFAWPLDDSGARGEHWVDFASPDTGSFRRVDDNLLRPEKFPTLARDGRLILEEAYFDEGALIFEHVGFDALEYRAPSGRGIAMTWIGFEQITVWTPLTGDLMCIEPWRGLPAPGDFAGDFADKPDQFVVPPGQSRPFAYHLALLT